MGSSTNTKKNNTHQQQQQYYTNIINKKKNSRRPTIKEEILSSYGALKYANKLIRFVLVGFTWYYFIIVALDVGTVFYCKEYRANFKSDRQQQQTCPYNNGNNNIVIENNNNLDLKQIDITNKEQKKKKKWLNFLKP